MEEEQLTMDEVKGIAREFVLQEWNAEITDIISILLSSDCNRYEVNGKMRMPQRIATGEPKRLPDNSPFYKTDTVYMECFFRLKISAKNGKVVGFSKNMEQAPPISPNFNHLTDPDAGVVLEEMRWERELKKDKTDSFEKKYGIDIEKFRL